MSQRFSATVAATVDVSAKRWGTRVTTCFYSSARTFFFAWVAINATSIRNTIRGIISVTCPALTLVRPPTMFWATHVVPSFFNNACPTYRTTGFFRPVFIYVAGPVFMTACSVIICIITRVIAYIIRTRATSYTSRIACDIGVACSLPGLTAGFLSARVGDVLDYCFGRVVAAILLGT